MVPLECGIIWREIYHGLGWASLTSATKVASKRTIIAALRVLLHPKAE
jgi:hypothetical protein